MNYSSKPELTGSLETRIDALTALIQSAQIELAKHRSTARTVIDQDYAHRRARDQVFGDLAGALFGEPAWDILLDLDISARKGRRVSISSAVIASSVPPTTGLRHVSNLQNAGLVQRSADPGDGRRHFIELTPTAERLLREWADTVA